MEAQRDPHSVRTLLGSAALVATLALLSPGLQVTRAGDGAAPTASTVDPSPSPPVEALPAAAATCNAAPAEPIALDDVILRQQQLLMQAEIARRAAGSPSAAQSTPEGIVLNGRGYNYAPQDGRQPGL